MTERAPAAARTAMRSLALDRATVEIVDALRASGIPSLLLKGPVLARWLYERESLRPYVDVDLLIPPADHERAHAVLLELGFARAPLETLPGDWPRHAVVFERADATVDLHRTLLGIDAEPERMWEALWTSREQIHLGGIPVDAVGSAARAVVVALHAAKDGGRVAKVERDLARALAIVPEATWEDAATLASRLEALPSFAAGLRRLPEGAALAARLGLPLAVPVDVAIRERGAPPLATGVEWLLTSPGVAGKASLVVRKVFPPRGYLRGWSPLARRGPLGLAAAYVWRPIWVAWHAGPAALAVLRARRMAHRTKDVPPGAASSYR